MDIYILYIQSSVNVCLCCFHFFFFLNNAALDTHTQVFVCTHVFISPGCTPNNDIAEWYGNSVYLWGTAKLFFSSSCAILNSYQ